MSRSFASTLLAALLLAACGPGKPPPGTAPAVVLPTEEDAATFNRLLDKAESLAQEIDKADALFDRDPDAPLSVDEQTQLLSLYAPFIDYLVAMDGVRAQFRTPGRASTDGGQSLSLVFGAHAASIWLGLEFVARVTGKEVFETFLDEAHPEVGLAAGLLSPIQNRVLDSDVFDHMQTYGKSRLNPQLPGAASDYVAGESAFVTVARRANAYGPAAQEILRKRGTALRLANLWQNIEDAVFTVVLPVQTAVARWMGDTRLWRSGTSLISAAQVDALVQTMQPGDIIVERRNWFVSNLGLPGFWPHAELYVGTRADLAVFEADPDVAAAYPAGYTTTLAAKYPAAWAAHAAADDGGARVVMEAVSEGVQFSTAHEAMLADYLGVMRPTLSALEKARAIERAYARYAQAYDFDFDFVTDQVVVCSELVYKSYQAPASEGHSLDTPLVSVAGRSTLPPGEFVRQFASGEPSYDTKLSFVAFLDGDESTGTAVSRTAADLVSTLVRPKWDWAQ